MASPYDAKLDVADNCITSISNSVTKETNNLGRLARLFDRRDDEVAVKAAARELSYTCAGEIRALRATLDEIRADTRDQAASHRRQIADITRRNNDAFQAELARQRATRQALQDDKAQLERQVRLQRAENAQLEQQLRQQTLDHTDVAEQLRQHRLWNAQLQRQVADLQRQLDVNQQPTPPPRPAPPQDAPMPASRYPSSPVTKHQVETWMGELGISYLCATQDAILNGNEQAIRNADRRDLKHAMHVAALSGSVHMARILLAKQVGVDSLCPTRNKDGTVVNVTPLHLAIGAQRYEMIEYLVSKGATLRVPPGASHAPPRWAVSERWMKWMRTNGADGTRDADGVIKTIDTLLSLNWDINADLNGERKRLLTYAKSMTAPRGQEVTRTAIIAFLRGQGARE